MDNPLVLPNDIHLPAAIGWWPLAWGWWVILLSITVVCTLLAVRWVKRRYRRAGIRQLNAHLKCYQQTNDKQVYLNNLLTLIRIVAITRYGRDNVAKLQGDHWINYINTKIKQPLFMDMRIYLTQAPFCANDYFATHYEQSCDVNALHQLTLKWINQHQ